MFINMFLKNIKHKTINFIWFRSIIFMCIKQRRDLKISLIFGLFYVNFPTFVATLIRFMKRLRIRWIAESGFATQNNIITHSGQCVLPYVRDQEWVWPGPNLPHSLRHRVPQEASGMYMNAQKPFFFISFYFKSNLYTSSGCKV